MNKFFYILCFLFSIATLQLEATEKQIEVIGIYRGTNLYVMNPFTSAGVGFCIYEVLVNGEISTDEISSNAFEIDLSLYNLSLGDKVKVIIKHNIGCTPKILNPEVLKPQSSFNIEDIKVSSSGKITWSTSGEIGSLPFYVEQFKWSKWVVVGQITGKGSPGINNYSASVRFTSGVNKFRIRQTDYSKKSRYSKIVTYKNISPEVTFEPGNGNKTSNYITFSTATDYEIYDYYGELQMKKYGSKADVSSLKSGTYFLNYDNKTEYFEKK